MIHSFAVNPFDIPNSVAALSVVELFTVFTWHLSVVFVCTVHFSAQAWGDVHTTIYMI